MQLMLVDRLVPLRMLQQEALLVLVFLLSPIRMQPAPVLCLACKQPLTPARQLQPSLSLLRPWDPYTLKGPGVWIGQVQSHREEHSA